MKLLNYLLRELITYYLRYSVLSTFIRTQINVLFPLRDEKEAELLQILIDMVIRNLQFPSIRSESLLLSCISYLFQSEEHTPLSLVMYHTLFNSDDIERLKRKVYLNFYKPFISVMLYM